MNIELILNCIQRIDKLLAMLYYVSIQKPCLPSDDSMTLKMETLSYSCLGIAIPGSRTFFINPEIPGLDCSNPGFRDYYNV